MRINKIWDVVKVWGITKNVIFDLTMKEKIGCHCRPLIETIHCKSWKLLKLLALDFLGVLSGPFRRLPASGSLPRTCPHVSRVSRIGHTPQGILTWEERRGYSMHIILQKAMEETMWIRSALKEDKRPWYPFLVREWPQCSRLKPSHEFQFEGLSNFSRLVEGLVQIQDVNPRI